MNTIIDPLIAQQNNDLVSILNYNLALLFLRFLNMHSVHDMCYTEQLDLSSVHTHKYDIWGHTASFSLPDELFCRIAMCTYRCTPHDADKQIIIFMHQSGLLHLVSY